MNESKAFDRNSSFIKIQKVIKIFSNNVQTYDNLMSTTLTLKQCFEVFEGTFLIIWDARRNKINLLNTDGGL